MIVRLAATMSVVFGITLFLLYLHVMGKGLRADEAARHLRAMKDRTAVPDSIAPFSIDQMAELPDGLPLDHYAELEAQAVEVEGFVQLMARAADGDFHLEVAPEAGGPDADMVPYVTAEITPQWHRASARWSFESLYATFRPLWGGAAKWGAGPRRVRVSGWLLYDYPVEGEQPKPGFAPRLSRWEIHPVSRIELWDDSLQAFVEYPS